MRDLLVGLDVGTSAVDACAFEPGGRLVARATRPLDTAYPRPGRAEQDPSSWTDGAVGAARCLAARLGPDVRSIAAVGLTGQCPSLALVDESGRPLTPGVIYQDTRATAEAARLSATLDAADVLARAGMAPSHYYLAAKVMWLAAHRPDLRTQRPGLGHMTDELCGKKCRPYR